MPRDAETDAGASRRDFLKTGAGVALSGTLGLNVGLSAGLYAAGNEILKVGLVGCGGRGTGAAREALKADPQARLVAMGDAFPEQIEASLESLKGVKDIGERVVVDSDFRFAGLEAYKHVIDNVDVVLLASPPGFRPYHLRYAVERNKHIFTEKPMATDAPGVRSVMESVKLAEEKRLALVAGFCWRYDYARRELFQRIHDGQIGDVLAIYGTYLTSPVKPMPPADTRPPGITDLEWMVRNWYNFTWLSGDGLVEQAIHTVDWLAWTMQDVPAESCTAVGGRQIPAHGGNIYDHIEVNYLWESGTRGFLAQRQIAGCYNENNLYVYGTKGTATITGRGVVITGESAWKYSGPGNNMYQTEHDEFFASIRSGKPINDGDRMAKSTLLGIMGRMAGYTGQKITWEMALNSQEELAPDLTSWNDELKTPPMAQPGVTPFV
jgi:myo-inositol 2-dehydrogenase/D-chiro-inositol 1-dehydrogenase